MVPRSGYDLPLQGLENGQFVMIHTSALVCQCVSIFSVLTVIVLSFKNKHIKTFFSWRKCDRFVVYMAICDGMFNIFHAMDHLQIVITKQHVRPRALCTFYAMVMGEFVAAQGLMVNIASINAFIITYYRMNVSFGRYDYKLLVWMFGFPAVVGGFAFGLDTIGPNGS